MKWQVNLIGDSEDLEYLNRIFHSPDLLVCREKDRFFLESSSFNNFSDVKDVKRETEKFLTAINATKEIARPSSTQIKRGSIHAIIDDKHRTLYAEGKILVSTKCRGRLTIIKKDGTIDDSPPESPMTRWIPLMDSDEKIQRAYRLINHDYSSYGGLYKIIEVVQEDNFPPVLENGEFYRDIRRFKHTAESYAAIGESARHAHSRFTSPETPMELSTAKDLVTRIVRKWLDSKI